MHIVKQILDDDFDRFVDSAGDAYPAVEIQTEPERQKVKEQYRGILLNDFVMNWHDKKMNAGGVGFARVDFSSMAMGVVSFGKLYGYGQARISDKSCIQKIDRLFTGSSEAHVHDTLLTTRRQNRNTCNQNPIRTKTIPTLHTSRGRYWFNIPDEVQRYRHSERNFKTDSHMVISRS